jgi:hypothetical protein
MPASCPDNSRHTQHDCEKTQVQVEKLHRSNGDVLMRSAAKAASLTASLLKHEPSQTTSPSTPPSPSDVASDQRSTPPALEAGLDALFFVKGDATARHFQRAAPPRAALAASGAAATTLPDDARRLRLWLRVDPRLRRRMKLAASYLAQTGQAFLLDALDALLAQPASAEIARPAPAPDAAAAPRVKLSLRVDAARRGAVQRLAADLGRSTQALLHAALDAHLERILGAPAHLSLRHLLDRDAAAGATVLPFAAPAHGGATVVPFSRRARSAAAPARTARRRVRQRATA